MMQAEKNITQLLRIGIFLVPFIPLIVTYGLYFPFITGKNFAFRILIEILAFFWLWMIVIYKRFRPRFSLIVAAYASFIAVLATAAIFSISPYDSFWSRFERMEGLMGHLHLFLYFLIAGSVLTTEQDWKKFFNISIAVSAMVTLYAFVQLVGFATITQGSDRVNSVTGNAIYLAVYILFHLFFIAVFYFKAHRGWPKYTYATLFLLEAIVLYYTFSRGPLLGFFIGATLFTFMLAFLERGRIRIFAVGGAVMVLLIPVAIFFAKDTTFVRSNDTLGRFVTAFDDPAASGRLTIWKMAIEGWKERPIIGWGQESFTYIFSKYYEPSLWQNEPWFDRAHNVYLDWLVAGGLLGFLAYLAIFGSAIFLLFKGFWRESLDRYIFIGIIALFAAYFFQNFFVFDSIVSYIPFFSVVAFIHATSFVGGTPVKFSAKSDAKTGFSAARTVVLIVAAGFLVYAIFSFNIRPMRVAAYLGRSYIILANPNPAGKVDALIKEFSSSINLKTFGTTEAREWASQNTLRILNDPGIVDTEKQKYLSFLIEQMEQQRKSNPYDVRAMAFVSDLYSSAGRFDDAFKTINEALQISDKRQQFYFVLGAVYLGAGKNLEAIEVLRKAYDLDQKNYQAMLNLSIALIVSGMANEGEDLVEKLLGTRIFGDDRYVEAYLTINDFDKAAQVLEKLIIISPSNFNYHLRLGKVYFLTGKKDKAIGEVRKAMELEPRFKGQGEAIIEDIEKKTD